MWLICLGSFSCQRLSCLLNKGLSFVPAVGRGNYSKLQTRYDIQTYHRRLKLMCFFKGNNRSNGPQQFTLASDKLIDKDLRFVDYVFRPEVGHLNLTEGDKVALKELVDNQNIIIKTADKGSAVVIMDREQYVGEAE